MNLLLSTGTGMPFDIAKHVFLSPIGLPVSKTADVAIRCLPTEKTRIADRYIGDYGIRSVSADANQRHITIGEMVQRLYVQGYRLVAREGVDYLTRERGRG